MDRTHGASRRALLVVLGLVACVLSLAAVGAQQFRLGQSQEPPVVGASPVAPAGPIDPPTPAVSLHVRAPASSAPGQEIDYRILIENQSGGAAHHVMVRAPLPANAVFVLRFAGAFVA